MSQKKKRECVITCLCPGSNWSTALTSALWFHVMVRPGITGSLNPSAWSAHEPDFLPGVWLPGSAQTVWQTNSRLWQPTADLCKSRTSPDRRKCVCVSFCLCVSVHFMFACMCVCMHIVQALPKLLNIGRNVTGSPSETWKWALMAQAQRLSGLLLSLSALWIWDQKWRGFSNVPLRWKYFTTLMKLFLRGQINTPWFY